MIGSEKEAKGVANLPFTKIPALEIENLDPPILAVTDINQIVIDRDRVGEVKLSRPAAFYSPAEKHVAVLIEFHHARIAFAVSDENISFPIKSDVGGLVKVENILARYSHST